MDDLRSLQQRVSADRLGATKGEKARDAFARDLARDFQETAIVRQAGGASVWRDLQPVDLAAIAEGLPPDGELVEYVRFTPYDFDEPLPRRKKKHRSWLPARYLAFVLDKHRPDAVQMCDLGEAAAIDKLVASFRERFAKGGRDLSAEPPPKRRAGSGEPLRCLLFDVLPLQRRERVLIAPDGEIATVPFEALPIDREFLVNRCRVSYVTSGRDLVRDASSTISPGAPLVIGAPNYDLKAGKPGAAPEPAITSSTDFRDRGLRFTPLQHTGPEVTAIAQMLRVDPCVGNDAVERTVKACKSPLVLHLATHGFFLARRDDESSSEGAEDVFGRLPADADDPLLRSALALAGANTWLAGKALPEEAEDGLLTAQDVVGLDLDGTELVVLSACDSGLGDVHPGEGVLGLRRAFLHAGARTLVMSLWKVPDRETKEIMVDFYERLIAGAGRAEALRQAQLKMQQKHPSEPLFWGAFICQGDTGPLEVAIGSSS
jgi:CHAT domain-containing protein